MDNLFIQYKNSLSSLWDDRTSLKNKHSFHTKVEDIRETIILTGIFLDELKHLEQSPTIVPPLENKVVIESQETINVPVRESTAEFRENEEKFIQKPEGLKLKHEPTIPLKPSYSFSSPIKEKPKEVVEIESDWFEFIIKNGGWVKDIPFRSKKDLFGEDSLISLSIQDNRLEMLAKQLAKEKRMVKDYMVMIKLLIQHSNAQGYITKEELKNLFMQEYKNDKVLIDFVMRYGVKKGLAHQSISSKFHVIIEHLRKQGLVKEFFRNSTYQIYWNFAIYVHH
jgi:hypothetical protein